MGQSEKESAGAIAFRLHTKITDNEIHRRKLLAQNAELLTEMIDGGYFRHYLGDPNAEPVSYYAQVEVFYSRNQIRRLITVKKILQDNFGIGLEEVFDIPESRLTDICATAKKENVNDLIEQARVLTPSDWKTVIRGLKGLRTVDNCERHDYKKTATCKNCGHKESI
jgi:hypothetical protein